MKALKFIVLLLISLFIIYKLVFRYKINQLFHQYSLNEHLGSIWLLTLAFLLMLLNWSCESYKWQLLINKFEQIKFKDAFKAVLSGVCLSIITPNQIGDFAGRVIHLQILNKIKGSLITVIGHTAQVIITCIFGIIAFLVLANTISINGIKGNYSAFWVQTASYFTATFSISIAVVMLIVLVVSAIFAFIHFKKIYQKIKGIKWVLKYEKYLNVFDAYSSNELLKILLISLLRYLVFLSQYYLLLRFFHVEIAPINAICCIIATFCVQSVVPSFFLLEIGLRGASALWFFGIFSTQVSGILLAAYSLWIINMMIPALLGMFFIYKLK